MIYKRIFVALLFQFLCLQVFSQFAVHKNGNRYDFSHSISGDHYFSIQADRAFSINRSKVDCKEFMGSYSWKNIDRYEPVRVILQREYNTHDSWSLFGNIIVEEEIIPFQVKVAQHEKESLQLIINIESDYGLGFHLIMKDTTYWFGGGVRYDRFLLNGAKVPVWVEEQGLGRGDMPISKFTKLLCVSGDSFSTYCPSPVLYSLNGQSWKSHSTSWQQMDISEKGDILWKIGSPELHLEFRTNIKEKKNSPLPEKYMGAMLGLQGGSKRVLSIVDSVLSYGAEVKSVWIQDWCGRKKTRFGSQLYWQWELDTQLYPEFDKFKSELNNRGIQLYAYINPFLAIDGNISKKAIQNGYLIKGENGKPLEIKTAGFPAYLMDLSNPEAEAFLIEIIHENIIGKGFFGWMADFGEWMPLHASLWNQESPEKWHNIYPKKWIELQQKAISKSYMKDSILVFHRSGFGEMEENHTVMWSGDQFVDFGKLDGLQSAFIANLSTSYQNLPRMHSDIGGYTSVKNIFINKIRNKELLFRWCESELFSPLYRTHEGLRPDLNYQIYSDSSSLAFYSRLTRLRKELLTVLYQNDTSTLAGLRPLFYALKKVEYAKIMNEAMMGDYLLFAPVLTSNTVQREVFLPEGNWIQVWNNHELEGNKTYTLQAPLGYPVMLVKSDCPFKQELIEIFNKHH